jgi:ribosomal RNA assembly protein
MKYLKIPKERIGVLIGPKGETKKIIEKIAKVKLEIDSDEGEIVIDDHESNDPILGLKTEDVIRAIGRGFSPDNALKIFNEEKELFIFDIHDYVGKKENHVKRLKSRIIGKNGKTKRLIENLTKSSLSIYGHTVSVISDLEQVDIAKRALDMLLSGSKHSTVYQFVEREMKKLRMGYY